jgi:hypothetical protein
MTSHYRASVYKVKKALENMVQKRCASIKRQQSNGLPGKA